MQVPYTNRSIKTINCLKPTTLRKPETSDRDKLSYFEKLKIMIARRSYIESIPEEQNRSRSKSKLFNRGVSHKKNKDFSKRVSRPKNILTTQNSIHDDGRQIHEEKKTIHEERKTLQKKEKRDLVNYAKFEAIVESDCKALQLKEVIGTGANASVRKGQSNGSVYAVKIYEKYKLLEPSKLKTVFKEIKLMKRLNHQDIIHLHGAHQNSKQIHVIMEYFEGKTLQQCLRENHFQLPLEVSLRVISKIAGVLHYLHEEMQIAHRDLKLENVLISQDMRSIRVIDFGYATSTLVHCESSCGTPNYMAPELFSKNAMYDGEKVDMWAFGVLCYHLLEGIFPFRGYDEKDLLRRIKQREIKYKRTPKEIRQVIDSLLEIDPSTRATARMVSRLDWEGFST